MNNEVTVVGRIETGFMLDVENHNERFFQFLLTIERTSGTTDTIPVVVSERLINVNRNSIGQYVQIKGEFRSRNAYDAKLGRTILLLYIFPHEIELIDGAEDVNDIFLEGYICRKPTHRKTPLGREISDVLLAVKRNYGKADYIPCVLWGRNAHFSSTLDVGELIRISGRIQSREYVKNEKVMTAYEVSGRMIEYVSE